LWARYIQNYIDTISTDYATSIALHTALSHLDKRNTYVRMLFIDYSSAFNTMVPLKLITKLPGTEHLPLKLDPGHTDVPPQVVSVGSNKYATLTLNTEAPQGCMLGPLLYSLFTHDCGHA
jgi:hypothetical protein